MLDSHEWTVQNILTAIQKAKEIHGAFLKQPRKKRTYEGALSR
jgi:hypothetical protein